MSPATALPEPQLDLADELRIVAGGGNGAEFVDVSGLLCEAADEIEKLKLALAWRTIETHPNTPQSVLLGIACGSGVKLLGVGRRDSRRWLLGLVSPAMCQPTHYLPLPDGWC